ncbi:hypothetical protein TWF694_005120 [Orbilia ellipsospora]|uniref:Uncharacterized protein n=1 Tax=Orbilia ellipsospora TaxID=2528407 RepID=A0AAV9X0R7_9PEZI
MHVALRQGKDKPYTDVQASNEQEWYEKARALIPYESFFTSKFVLLRGPCSGMEKITLLFRSFGMNIAEISRDTSDIDPYIDELYEPRVDFYDQPTYHQRYWTLLQTKLQELGIPSEGVFARLSDLSWEEEREFSIAREKLIPKYEKGIHGAVPPPGCFKSRPSQSRPKSSFSHSLAVGRQYKLFENCSSDDEDTLYAPELPSDPALKLVEDYEILTRQMQNLDIRRFEAPFDATEEYIISKIKALIEHHKNGTSEQNEDAASENFSMQSLPARGLWLLSKQGNGGWIGGGLGRYEQGRLDPIKPTFDCHPFGLGFVYDPNLHHPSQWPRSEKVTDAVEYLASQHSETEILRHRDWNELDLEYLARIQDEYWLAGLDQGTSQLWYKRSWPWIWFKKGANWELEQPESIDLEAQD